MARIKVQARNVVDVAAAVAVRARMDRKVLSSVPRARRQTIKAMTMIRTMRAERLPPMAMVNPHRETTHARKNAARRRSVRKDSPLPPTVHLAPNSNRVNHANRASNNHVSNANHVNHAVRASNSRVNNVNRASNVSPVNNNNVVPMGTDHSKVRSPRPTSRRVHHVARCSHDVHSAWTWVCIRTMSKSRWYRPDR